MFEYKLSHLMVQVWKEYKDSSFLQKNMQPQNLIMHPFFQILPKLHQAIQIMTVHWMPRQDSLTMLVTASRLSKRTNLTSIINVLDVPSHLAIRIHSPSMEDFFTIFQVRFWSYKRQNFVLGVKKIVPFSCPI